MAETTEVNERAEQAKEMAAEAGKKLTGFLGGLAEKAKNIDVKELAEKAKTKVGEVQSRANELASGKTEAFASPREDVTAAQMKEIFQKIGPEMGAMMSPAMECVLADALLGEAAAVKMRSSEADGAVGLALTPHHVIFLAKVSEQYGASVYPVRKVSEVTLLPPRGDVAGRFVLTAGDKEIRFPLVSVESHCKAILFYKKFLEVSAK